MELPQSFVEEIDPGELYFHEVVGKGAFGVVSRANYRGNDVAVKIIETESERKAFLTEMKQLSRVNHPNIVKLYGACTRAPAFLVMEYAEGGSLYNVLHGAGRQPEYTAAHAMSWALQCARGVEYLHSMKPKALIHRDLKPPNLLLIMGGTVLKICDFGTACDIQTHMTNNKGSAAWMAPEVFEGSNYSEKCDVFSWGIIIWEIFTRRKPFDEIGGPAFRIMWAVHNGTRPPLIRNFPKPLEILMTRCWSGNPPERPSMAEVVRIMSFLFQFFSGADEPLVYPAYQDSESPDCTFNLAPTTGSSQFSGPSSTNSLPQATGGESRTSTISETVRHSGDYLPPLHPIPQRVTTPTTVPEEDNRGQKSAPPSLAASRESLIGLHSPRSSTPVDQPLKRHSADVTNFQEYDTSRVATNIHPKVLGHRRSGSHGTPVVVYQTSHQNTPIMQYKGTHRRIGSDGYSDINLITQGAMAQPPSTISIQQSPPATITHVSTYPGTLSSSRETTPTPHSGSLGGSRENTPPYRSVSYNPPSITEASNKPPPSVRSSSWAPDGSAIAPLSVNVNLGPAMANTGLIGHVGSSNVNNIISHPLSNQAMTLVYQSLDHQYQPIPPCPTNSESMEIFQSHCQLAQQYLKYQTEIAMFEQTRHELMKELQEDDAAMNQQTTAQLNEEYCKLSIENESLRSFHKNLTLQLELIFKERNSNKTKDTGLPDRT